MKKYLSTIHQRSPAHKRRFALVVSGGITLIIFTIWSFVTFANTNPSLANQNSNSTDNQKQNLTAVSPFADLSGGVANTIDAVKQQINQIKQAVSSSNIQNQYQQVRDQALTN